MDPLEGDLNLRDYLHILRRRAPMIIGLTILGALIGFLYASSQPQRFAASSDVRILDPNSEAVFEGANIRIDPKREVDTQIEIIESVGVRAAADAKLGDRADDIDAVVVSNVADTDIVKIRVESQDPAVARDGANAIADAYVETRRAQTAATLEARATELRNKASEFKQEVAEIDAAIAADPESADRPSAQARRESLLDLEANYEQRAAELESTADLSSGNAEVVDEAQLPPGAFEPRPARSGLVGGLLGLLIGVCLAFVLERLSDEVNADNVAGIVGAPVLGAIPLRSTRKLRRHHLPDAPRVIAERDSVSAEAFRTLRTSVRFSNLGKTKKVLAVTSASESEGKSTVTANLALALAESGLRIVAISGDLRRPMLASFFGLDDTQHGLTSVLLGDVGLIEALVKIPVSGTGQLAVLPSGPVPPNPAELLGSNETHDVLDRLVAAGADLVLIDCPPVLPVADALALSQFVDGVLLVCVPGQTHAEALRRASGKLRQVGAELIGVVANGVARSGSYGGYGYGGYGGYGGYASSEPSGNKTNGSGATTAAPDAEHAAPVS